MGGRARRKIIRVTQRIEQIGPFRYQRHAARLPALQDGQEPHAHEVVVVGGGPVGLSSALGLARWGIPSVVIEVDDSVCEGSRAACIRSATWGPG